MLLECKPILEVTIQSNKSRSSPVIGRDSVSDTIVYTSSDTLRYDFPDSYGFVEVTPTITPSLFFSLDYDTSGSGDFLVNFFELSTRVDASIFVRSELNLQKNGAKLLKVPLLKDKTLKKSVLIIYGVPIPYKLSLDISYQLNVDLIEAKVSTDATLDMSAEISCMYSSQLEFGCSSEPFDPKLASYNFELGQLNEQADDARITIKNSIIPTLKLKIPFIETNKTTITIVTPSWLTLDGSNSSTLGVIPVPNFGLNFNPLTISVDLPIFQKNVLKLCSVECVALQSDKPIANSMTIGVDEPKVNMKLFFKKANISIPMSVESEPVKICLARPNHVECSKKV